MPRKREGAARGYVGTPPFAYALGVILAFDVSLGFNGVIYRGLYEFHWQHLVNGYSGFFPPSYQKVVNAVRNFPDQMSMNATKSHGVRYLVIHGEWLLGDRYEALVADLDRRSDLARISRHAWARPGKHAAISVYRVSYSDTR